MEPSRVLILGSAPGAARVAQEARDLGAYVVAVDARPHTPLASVADEAHVVAWGDHDALYRVASEARVDCIYPTCKAAILGAAVVAERLGLPGNGVDAATRLTNRRALYDALVAAGLSCPAYRVARTAGEADGAAHALALPLAVRPEDSAGGAGVQRVDFGDDMPLAWAKAVKASESGAVLIQSWVEGREFVLDIRVDAHEVRVVGLHEQLHEGRSPCVVTGVVSPPDITPEGLARLEKCVSEASAALGLGAGWVNMEIIDGPDGPVVIDAAPWPMSAILPMVNRGRGGRTPEINGDCPYLCVLWKETRSGVVLGVEGVEAAREVAGVVEVAVRCRVGDVLGHVVDCASRDRVGYVAAVGRTADEAVEAARRARELIVIEISPVL